MHGVGPVRPPSRSAGVSRTVVQHVDDAVVQAVAARQPRPADVARHQLEGNPRTVLHIGQRIVGAEALLARQEHAGDARDHDQAEATGSGGPQRGDSVHAARAHSWATVVTVWVPVLPVVPAFPARLSSKTIVMVHMAVLVQLMAPVVVTV